MQTVLVAAALPRDAELTAGLLERHGLHAIVCAGIPELAERIGSGAGMALVTEELLDGPALDTLGRVLATQPAWSDFPFLVFTGTESTTVSTVAPLGRLAGLGNVSLLERPVRTSTLVSAVTAGLRSRRRQHEVRALLGELEDGVRQRDQFLAMLGHELRNPLSAMMTAAHVGDLLVRRSGIADLEETYGRQHAIIRRQGQMLTRLMDDLLDVSRLRSGKVRVAPAPIDMRDVLARVGETMAGLAERRGITLAPMPALERPLPVLGDATRLEQVLYNLLHNALKYTRPGGRVEVFVGTPAGVVEIGVRDTGAGIEPELLPRIFELFRQVDSTLDRADGGLGLGLTLAKSLVELHAGTLTAHSDGLGKGSTFMVRLPRLEASALTPAKEVVPAARNLHGLSVFVLEDREDNCEALVVALRALGCSVESARDGSEGVEQIVERRPRAALVDIGLPGLDGYEVARRIRGELGAGILLIALTGYGMEEDRRRATAAGFDVHLTKPVDLQRIEQLLSTVGAA